MNKYNTRNILLGVLLGFVFYCFLIPDKGEYSSAVMMYNFHVHHWIYLGIILIGILVARYQVDLLIGFCIGGIIQDLTVNPDWNVMYHLIV